MKLYFYLSLTLSVRDLVDPCVQGGFKALWGSGTPTVLRWLTEERGHLLTVIPNHKTRLLCGGYSSQITI
jgi:hypothetical protein